MYTRTWNRSGNDFPVAFSFRCVLKGTGEKSKPRSLAIPSRNIYIQVYISKPIRLGRYFTRIFSFPPLPLLKPEIKRISSGIAVQAKGE